jgi:shikimate kinase
VADIFDTRGEAAFRASERRVLRELARDEDSVIACGGGVVTDEESREILKCSGTVVYLAVSPEDAVARIGAETEARPLLPGEPRAAGALMAAREPLYAASADVTVDTSGRSAEQVAEVVAGLLDARS